jgi:hypothetical protein
MIVNKFETGFLLTPDYSVTRIAQFMKWCIISVRPACEVEPHGTMKAFPSRSAAVDASGDACVRDSISVDLLRSAYVRYCRYTLDGQHCQGIYFTAGSTAWTPWRQSLKKAVCLLPRPVKQPICENYVTPGYGRACSIPDKSALGVCG